MGFYYHLFETNKSGWHVFDGIVLENLTGFTVEDQKAVPDGKFIQIKSGSEIISKDLVLHKNGEATTDNLVKSRVVMSIEKLAALPDELQERFYAYEQVPGGRRP